MEKQEFKNKIRNIVHKIHHNDEKQEIDPFEQYGDFSKFPELRSLIYTLFTVDFHFFINSIDWIAPNPTTFCVTLTNKEYLFLIFNKRGWVVQIEGKKYYISNMDEETQATEAISRLLYYSQALDGSEEDEEDNDWEKPKSKSGSSSSSSSSSSSAPASDTASDTEETPKSEDSVAVSDDNE